jgi:hypothetical protein
MSNYQLSYSPPTSKLWLLFLLLLLLIITTKTTKANCNLAIEDWRRITVALKDHYYYAYFRDMADCDENYPTPTSLIQRYGDCQSKTLSDAVKALGDTCETTLAQVLYVGSGQTTDKNVQLASNYCKDTLADAIRYRLCDPLGVIGCPSPLQLANFSPFGNCLVPVINMTDAQASVFFANALDKKCADEHGVCAGVAQWADCPITMNETFSGLDHLGNWKCTKLFKTVLDRCNWSFKKVYDTIYCAPVPFLDANGKWIGIGVGASAVLILGLFLLYRRCYKAHHISHEELLSQSMLSMHDSLHIGTPGSSPQKMYIHPEMHAAIAKASKYRGVEFNSQTNQWAANGRTYSNEMEAAQAAYFLQAQQQLQEMQMRQMQQQQQMMMMMQQQQQQQQQQQMMMQNSPNSGSARFYQEPPGFSAPAYQYQEREIEAQYQPPQPPAPPAPLTPEQITQRRKEQLIEFYKYFDSEKPDIEEHVNNLFDRHNFEHIARAVKTKYGLLPPLVSKIP